MGLLDAPEPDASTAPSEHLTFKGGTSLSKVYDIIERFREDVDLTVAGRAPLRIDIASPMETGISSNERERRDKALKQEAQNYFATIALPNIEQAINVVIGP